MVTRMVLPCCNVAVKKKNTVEGHLSSKTGTSNRESGHVTADTTAIGYAIRIEAAMTIVIR